MTLIEVRQSEYLQKLLGQDPLNEIAGMPISAIVTGSSTDEHLIDSFSDWDFKIFVPARDIQPFIARYSDKYAFSDINHDPNVFVLVRPIEFITDHEFHNRFVIAMWIYGNARILRDDFGQFQDVVKKQLQIFQDSLEQIIKWEYLRLRTYRHGIDSVSKRTDEIATQMLVTECIKSVMNILHLIHGGPYPYLQWLHKKTLEKFGLDFPELFVNIDALIKEKNLATIPSKSRELVNELLDVMVQKGFSREVLEKWWLHI